MLRSTFIHLNGVGPSREKALWKRGVFSWDGLRRLIESGEFAKGRRDIRKGSNGAITAGTEKGAPDRETGEKAVGERETIGRRDGIRKPPGARPEELLEELRASEAAIETGDAAFFADRLPMRERYRLARDFEGRICFLDIETGPVGGDISGITVAGIYDGRRARVLIRGADLGELPDALSTYPAVCTFNGASFDMPCLAAEFGRGFYRGAHIDLRPILASAGLRGGLKAIEARLGLSRPPGVRGLDGFDAVRLWVEASGGSAEAFELLARYNMADTVVLHTLLRLACNLRIAAGDLPFRRFDGADDPDAWPAAEDALRSMPRPDFLRRTW
ncbi:MAG: ribonuclease H-like domain-containing protein [Planctomycetota bacterium]|nr:ribonuclease H-like domain-containing protein [Planctomycetota bacterium]